MGDRPLTVNEAAEFLSVNPWQIRFYINKGLLRAYKLGNGTGKRRSHRRWRIWRQDLLEFLQQGSNTQENPT